MFVKHGRGRHFRNVNTQSAGPSTLRRDWAGIIPRRRKFEKDIEHAWKFIRFAELVSLTLETLAQFQIKSNSSPLRQRQQSLND